jgi:hypothetical protein
VYPVIEEWPLAKYFYVKDSTKVDNLLRWEWQECRSRTKRPSGTQAAGGKKKVTTTTTAITDVPKEKSRKKAQ